MGMFVEGDKKHYCGKYKGIDVWQIGQIIGSNWYGDYYVTVPRGATRRNMKVKDSVCRTLAAVKGYIDRNRDELRRLSGYKNTEIDVQ
jgi:hypothetical protein